MRFWMMAAAAMAIAVPASAQVTLIPGQGVTLTVGAGGAIEPEAKHPAQLSATDMRALGLVRKSYEVDRTGKDGGSSKVAPITITHQEVPPDPIIPGRVELVFVVVENKDTVLVVRNGCGRSFAYRARITARGSSAPTDVCIVKPNGRGYEHWPYVIDKIELTELTFEDHAPGGPPICR
ncbi:MAG: hypothetical protein ACAH11_14490 [Sphingomonas sp.]